MMQPLISVDEAKDHLRIDGNDDDPWLQTWIMAVSYAVSGWLGDENRCYSVDSHGDPLEDSHGDYTVHDVVKAAVLVELAQQYRFRDGSGAGLVEAHWGHGHTLGRGATALLTPLRKGRVS